MSKTRKEADEKLVNDSIFQDLSERYKMDAQIWQNSKRGFPFNIPQSVITSFCLGIPLTLTLITFDLENKYLWTLYLKTLAISVIAYLVTDKLIL